MKINKNVAISDSGLVFNPVNGESFSVNPIGAEIIGWLKEGKSREEIVASMLDRYSIDQVTAEKDLNDFLTILTHHNILETHAETKA